MSFIARIEQFCAVLIERAFAKTFPSDLEPAQIARKLVATMEAHTRDEDGRLRAPGSYTVYVSPSDFDRLAPNREYLERAWTELLADLAAKVGVAFEDNAITVVMIARPNVPLGAIEVEVASKQPAATRFLLRTVVGVPSDGVYAIEGTSRIGRTEECEIVVNDPSVSRTHAVVEIAGGAATVRDLGSTNGTFANGRRVERHRLEHGDELQFGNTRMRFEAR